MAQSKYDVVIVGARCAGASLEYPFDIYVGHVGPDVRALFRTACGQLLRERP